MGTLASMSVSIVVDGKLWGLISCHDHDAAPRCRSKCAPACEHLGQMLSLQIEAQRGAARERLPARAAPHAVAADRRRWPRPTASSTRLRRRCVRCCSCFTRSSGAAVIVSNDARDAHRRDAGAGTACWRSRTGSPIESEDVVCRTDALAQDCPRAARHSSDVAGVLAVSISQVHRHYVIWFRPEVVQTIEWAGDPRKLARRAGRIPPRASFDSWTGGRAARSLPWHPAELRDRAGIARGADRHRAAARRGNGGARDRTGPRQQGTRSVLVHRVARPARADAPHRRLRRPAASRSTARSSASAASATSSNIKDVGALRPASWSTSC